MAHTLQEVQRRVAEFERLWKKIVEWAVTDAPPEALIVLSDLIADAIEEFRNVPLAADLVTIMQTSEEILRMRRAELDDGKQ